MFKTNKISSIAEFETLSTFIKDELYYFDNELSQTYNKVELSKKDWCSEIYFRYNNNVKYIIVITENKLAGYTSYIEDDVYENFYIKNLTIHPNYINKTVVLRLILNELLNEFTESKYDIVRLATHKMNKRVNSICNKKGFVKSEISNAKDYYLYTISKDEINKIFHL